MFFILSLSSCRFVDKYTEFKSHTELDDAALFEETGKALLTDGIVLRRRGAPPVRVLHKVKLLTRPANFDTLIFQIINQGAADSSLTLLVNLFCYIGYLYTEQHYFKE